MSVCPSVRLRGVSKEFLLSHSGIGSIKTLLLWWQRRRLERLQVLKGIDLDIYPGGCTALIGRNGAGKSTLLALIARVYKPTTGEIVVAGRLAPLLELGAGFHPDLTGIENVLFNGVVLGLTRAQVRERLPSIVSFSGLEHHIDSPVRTYSSGMLARLGFSVAIHVDADVLIVDEVLAVGDLAFEERCYEKIAEFRNAGKTVLFVSHDLDAISRVAQRCVWLSDGIIAADGSPQDVIREYQAAIEGHEAEPLTP